MASIKRWLRDRANDAQGVYHQVNMFDNGRTYDTNRRGVTPTLNPQQRAQASIDDANQKIAQTPRFGVLADPQRREDFTREQEQGNQMNRAIAAVSEATKAIPKVSKAVVKPFWETADIAKAAVQRDQGNFRESLDQSVIGGVGRFGQSVASAALTPVSNRLANQEAARAERLLTPVYGRNNAEIEAGRIKYDLMTDPLRRSNIGVNDSTATTIRKVGAQGAEAALDILSAPATAVATKAAITSPTRQFVKQAINSGTIGAAGNVANVAQQDQVTIPDIVKAGGVGFATGVALPVVTKAGGMAAKNIKENFVRPSVLNDAEVADLRAFREQAGTGAIMDDATYQRGILAAQKAGIDYREPAQVDDLLGKHLTFQTRQAQRPRIPLTPLDERGSIQLPGKNDPLIQEYADMLKSLGEGNGVSINKETGARMTNNYRSADLKGKRMTKADWYAEAERQIKTGQADPDFMRYYNENNSPEIQSLINDAEAGKFGKEPLGEVAQQPELPKPEQPRKRLAPPPEFDPMERVFAENPMNEKMADLQSRRATRQEETNQKINEEFQSKGAELPVEGVKLTKNIDKAFRSTRSIIERQGKAGQELAGDLQKSRDVEEIYQAEILKQIPTVRSLKGSDYENFVDATQGLAKPNNPKVEQAVAEWKAVHPSIRDRAVAAGLDVGDLGPEYYPHFIDYDEVFKDKNKYNQAINHIVQTGQAPNAEEAIKLLGYARDVSRNRKFGNLEASRLVDIPFYDKTKESLTSYIQGSSKRISQAEIFGKADEKALEKIAQIGKEGGDTEAAKNAYDVAVGAKQYSPTASKVSGGIRKYNTVTKLGLGALTNVSQNVNTGIVTGHLRTAKAMLKQLDPKTREFVGDTGVIADAVINDLKKNQGYTTFTSKVLGKGLNYITAPGFGAVEKFNRAVAATAGRDYALRLAQTGDEATLRKLGVTGKIGKELTEEQQIQAARKIVEKTQFKVDPQDLPGWTDSPGGKMVAQFRTFSYSQGKFFSNEIIKPIAKGNVMPFARLLAAMPLGYALYETRRMIDGRPEEENYTKRVLAMFNKIGGAGLASDVYQGLNPIGSKYLPSDRRQSMAVSTFLGPTAGTASQAVGAVSDTIQRKNIPKDESRLEGKVAVGKTDDSYTDLTSMSRFGLSQVPVVGNAIKNRVLPYKKESNADAGKDPVKDLVASKVGAADLNTTGKEDFDTIAKAAFGSAEGKKFMALKNDDARKEYARQSPENRKLYDEYESMKKAFSKPGFYPSGMSKESTDILDKRDRLDTKAREAWDTKLSNKLAYEKATLEKDKLDGKLDDAEISKKNLAHAKLQYALDNGVQNSKDVDALFEEPKHKYAWKVKEWEEKSKDSKYVDSTEDFKDQEELGKLAVQKDYSKKAVDIFSMSEKNLGAYLDSIGGTDKQTWDELVKLDQAMIAAGLQKSSKLDGGGSGRGRGGKGKKVSDALISTAIKTPSVGKIRQSQISAKAPSTPAFKAKRKAIPKTRKTPQKLVVRKTA